MHHYLPLDPSVHEEGSKVDGPLDLTIGSHFGSRSSELNALLNSCCTYVPLTSYIVLLRLCDFENFHISQLPQYTWSVLQGSRREARLVDMDPPYGKSLWVDPLQMECPFKFSIYSSSSFFPFHTFETFHFSHFPTLTVHFISVKGLWWEARLVDTDGSYGKSLWDEVVKLNCPFKFSIY